MGGRGWVGNNFGPQLFGWRLFIYVDYLIPPANTSPRSKSPSLAPSIRDQLTSLPPHRYPAIVQVRRLACP